MRRSGAVRVPVLLVALLAAGCTDRGDPAGTATTAAVPPGTKTVVRLDAEPVAGAAAVTPAQLDRVRKIIAARIEAAGMGDSTVEVDGQRLVVTIEGQHSAESVAAVAAPADLAFRKVLRSSPEGAPGQGVTIPGPSGAATAGPATAGQATATTAGPATSVVPTGPAGRGQPVPQLSDVTAKVGARAMALAESISEPSGAAVSAEYTATLAPFAALTPAEVAVLPAGMQYALPQITCATLNRRPLSAVTGTRSPVAACDTSASTRYLLDRPAVTGPDLAGAEASIDRQSGQWKIDVTFTSDGQRRWTALTREAYQNVGNVCLAVAQCQVAIVVDHRVISAPEIQGVITGPAQIVGAFTPTEAKLLAGQLASGSLPVVLSVSSVDVQRPR